MNGANDKNQAGFGEADVKQEAESFTGTKRAGSTRQDLCFKSYRRDPLARLIIDRLKLKPYQFALVMLGTKALFYALISALYAVFYPSGVLTDFLVWARRSWAHLVFSLIPPGIMGFYCWINIATGRLFDGLVKDRIVEANSERLHDMVLDGKGSIEEAYNRRTWVILSILVVVLAVLLSIVRSGFREAVGAIGSDIMLFNAVMLPLTALQVYTISMIVAQELTTIRSLGKLFGHTSINVRPLHPDRCGGLRRLRDFAIIFTYLIALAGLGLCLLGYLSFQAGHLATDYYLHFLLASYLILAPYCFFATLGTAHRAMKAAKESFLRNISEQFQSTYAETQKQLTSKHGKLRESLGKIEQLQTLHKLTRSFPVWPFDARSIQRFSITTAAPLLSFVVPAIIDRFF